MTTQIVTTESVTLTRTKAPSLPIAPTVYSRQYGDQLNNVLRLYFNQLDNFILQLNAGGTGLITGLNLPYGAFHQNGETTLSTSISNVSTTPIVVASTTGFPSSGWILIENEIISYTAKTSTTFTGITRGVLGTTNVAHTSGLKVTEVQGTGSSTTIAKLLFNNTDYSNGVSIDATDQTKVVFANAGVYNIQFSAQLLNYTTSEDNVTLWMRVNGVDIPASAGITQVNSKHGTSPGAVLVSWNFVYSFAANNYLQVVWTSNTGNTVIATYPSSSTAPVHPASPGIILTATYVSVAP